MESDAGKPPVARLLSAGAKGAERVAHAAGVDRALDEAVEEAIVRALRSPAIGRALERAIASRQVTAGIEGEDIVQVVREVLESPAAAQVWDEVLASEQAQKLVERVASAPEVRAAIAAQGAGLITDIGVRLTRLTERLDDAMERITREDDESETNQAGLATRLVAGAVDVGLLFAAYSLISGLGASVINVAFGRHLSTAVVIVLGVIGLLTAGGVIAAFWALAGQTPGMRFLSIRLVQNGSRDVTAGTAIKRLFAMLLSVLPFGLGFFAILRNPSRHAWHDRLTGTEVIYEEVPRAPHARVRSMSPAARAGQIEKTASSTTDRI